MEAERERVARMKAEREVEQRRFAEMVQYMRTIPSPPQFHFFCRGSWWHSAKCLPSTRQKALGKLGFADTWFAQCKQADSSCVGDVMTG